MPKRQKIFYKSLILLLASVIALSIPQALFIDESLTLVAYDYFSNNSVTALFTVITDYTLGAIIGPLLIFVYFIYKKLWRVTTVYSLSFALLYIARYILQVSIARPRPFLVFDQVLYLGGASPLGNSFPSWHATSAFFLVFFVSKTLKLTSDKTLLLYLLAILVAVSRVYLGAHYPLDVLTGSALGMLWGYLTLQTYQLLRR